MASPSEILALLNSPSSEDQKLILESYAFAEGAHKDHKRNSGEPYFTHLFETARSLAEMGMGAKTIAAGLLHDSIEDVGVKRETIREKFGDEVLFLVDGVTKLGSIKYRGLERHTESLRKLFVATSQDIRVLIIKLMDRLHNMKTLQFVPKAKQKRIALETLEVYSPIADRLGMGKLKRELDDLAFPFAYPKEYEETKKIVKTKSEITQKHLEKLHKSIKKELAKNGITHFKTDYRVKSLYSTFQKLLRKENEIEKIRDIAALRIVVPTVADCYKVLGVVHSNWRPLPGKIKDYIAFPKPNGYRSIHTTIFTGDGGIVEIQIRTDEMHREAEFGIASHFFYKESPDEMQKTAGRNIEWFKQLVPSLISPLLIWKKSERGKGITTAELPTNAPAWVKDLAEAHTQVEKSKEYLEALKSDFFNYRVFVFTPKGDVLDLPVDSSPIDFAYALHTAIGNHISGVKVNEKLVSLDTKLHNGDIVEIITKESSHPTSKWLDIVKTTHAKKQIRLSLSERENIETGKN